MSTQVHCDRCGSLLTGPEPVKSLLVWRWRGGMPADAEMCDLCDTCREEFIVWLNFESATITVKPASNHR